MGFLDWLFGSPPKPAPAPTSTKPSADLNSVAGCLAAAGWTVGRQCETAAVERALANAGFEVHDIGRTFLREFLSLGIDVPISGAEGVRGFVQFSPQLVLRFLAPASLPLLRELMPASAFPIGTTGGNTMFVFMDAGGKSYLLDMEWTLFGVLASDPTELIAVLCDGRNGRVDTELLGDQARRTGVTITAENERRHWGLEHFPRMAPFLPAVSLSPGRRPPTWRPLVRTAEASMGPSLVTCGGFTAAPSGEMYFVSHCENSLYVREKAGLRVSGPPPGVPEVLKTGQIVPFGPPAEWSR